MRRPALSWRHVATSHSRGYGHYCSHSCGNPHAYGDASRPSGAPNRRYTAGSPSKVRPACNPVAALPSNPSGVLPYTDTDTCLLTAGPLICYARNMAISDRQLLDTLSRTPFVDSTELALLLGEPHATVHRALTGLLADGIVGRVSHGTVHLPSSQRYHLTANGIRQAVALLGYDTPSDFVRAYPMSREWLTLLIRRMDAVASVYRLAASMSPGIDGLRSRVEFHRRGRFDATITLHDGRSFGVVRQGLALRRRSLYDRLRAIAEYDYSRRRPGTVLILVPSVWEERLTTRFCEERNIRDCYVAVESRDALERRDLRLWC